jgi:GH24 family phage-related lysozyme (muramidase)
MTVSTAQCLHRIVCEIVLLCGVVHKVVEEVRELQGEGLWSYVYATGYDRVENSRYKRETREPHTNTLAL